MNTSNQSGIIVNRNECSPYTCDCGKVFKTKTALLSHQKWKHENLSCELCEKQFSSRFNLKRHVTICNNKQDIAFKFTCSVCGVIASNKSALNEHYQSDHEINLTEKHLEFKSIDEVCSEISLRINTIYNTHVQNHLIGLYMETSI